MVVINHLGPVPWMHTFVDCVASADDDTFILAVPLVNDVSDIVLLVIEKDEWQS